MLPIEHVVCPVDLSPASASGLRHARSWARRHAATLHPLHVAPFPQAVVSATGQTFVLPTRPIEAIRSDVERFVAAALADEPRPTSEVVEGDAVTAILDEAAPRSHTLLVMGTHGWSGLDRLLLGSVTERVAHAISCPLLVVPPRATTGFASIDAPSRLLCAVEVPHRGPPCGWRSHWRRRGGRGSPWPP